MRLIRLLCPVVVGLLVLGVKVNKMGNDEEITIVAGEEKGNVVATKSSADTEDVAESPSSVEIEGKNVLVLWSGRNYGLFNGEDISLTAEPEIINGRIYATVSSLSNLEGVA